MLHSFSVGRDTMHESSVNGYRGDRLDGLAPLPGSHPSQCAQSIAAVSSKGNFEVFPMRRLKSFASMMGALWLRPDLFYARGQQAVPSLQEHVSVYRPTRNVHRKVQLLM